MSDLFGERPDVPVMSFAMAAQLYADPHVHDPDGFCIRNRFNTPCGAPDWGCRPDTNEEGV